MLDGTFESLIPKMEMMTSKITLKMRPRKVWEMSLLYWLQWRERANLFIFHFQPFLIHQVRLNLVDFSLPLHCQFTVGTKNVITKSKSRYDWATTEQLHCQAGQQPSVHLGPWCLEVSLRLCVYKLNQTCGEVHFGNPANPSMACEEAGTDVSWPSTGTLPSLPVITSTQGTGRWKAQDLDFNDGHFFITMGW